MGNDADTEESNKHVRKNDTGHSLQQEECDEVSESKSSWQWERIVMQTYVFSIQEETTPFAGRYLYVLYITVNIAIFKEDDERDSGMAVAHSSVISEDLVNTKARGYYDGKTVLVQANGTPEKKVCIMLITVAKLICYIFDIG